MKTRNDFWMIVILFIVILVAMSVLSGYSLLGREYIVFAFLLFVPGLSLEFLFPVEDRLTRIFLIIVASIGIDTVVTEAVLYLGVWSPELILVILIIFSLVMMLFELFSKRHNQATSSTP